MGGDAQGDGPAAGGIFVGLAGGGGAVALARGRWRWCGRPAADGAESADGREV